MANERVETVEELIRRLIAESEQRVKEYIRDRERRHLPKVSAYDLDAVGRLRRRKRAD